MSKKPKTAGVAREGDYAVIRVPIDKLHSVRVALEDCPCRTPKSGSTAKVRKWLRDQLARLA